MTRILFVFGTRPETIKMAPLMIACQKRPDDVEFLTCNTAQHHEMLNPLLELFEITTHYNLDVMIPDQSLYDLTASVIRGMQSVLEDAQPDLMMVQGDTTTTFAAALAAYYAKVDVGHVEAGLRTYDAMAPYPEEINRQLTSRIARFHFAPTVQDRHNLQQENIPSDDILVTGNTVVDALLLTAQRLDRETRRRQEAVQRICKAGYRIDRKAASQRLILVTAHRRESFGAGMVAICEALEDIARAHPDLDIVYPVHLNPNVQQPVNQRLNGIDNIHLIAPLDYEAFVLLMKTAYFILTDSGGIQEEAPSLGKPVLVMREVTERPAAVEAGSARVIGADKARITANVNRLLTRADEYQKMVTKRNPYGDGKAAEKIITFILEQKLRRIKA